MKVDTLIHLLSILTCNERSEEKLIFLNPKPQTEIFFHERKAIPQFHLWFPAKQFLCFGYDWFSLPRIIRSVLHYLYLHIWINKLQNEP